MRPSSSSTSSPSPTPPTTWAATASRCGTTTTASSTTCSSIRTARRIPLKVRSFVGLIPLFAAETIEHRLIEKLPDFAERAKWFQKNRPDLCSNIFHVDRLRRLARASASVARRSRSAAADPRPHARRARVPVAARAAIALEGARSRARLGSMLDGHDYAVRYQPGDSDTGLFGGNSNWRGPVWFPRQLPDDRVAAALPPLSRPRLHRRVPDGIRSSSTLSGGRRRARAPAHQPVRPRCGGSAGRPTAVIDRFDHDPHWKDHVTFNEYFHGDTGKGLGAPTRRGGLRSSPSSSASTQVDSARDRVDLDQLAVGHLGQRALCADHGGDVEFAGHHGRV